MTPEQVDEAVVDYNRGASVADLAERFGVKPASVTRWLRSRGVVIRRAGGTAGGSAVELTGGEWVPDPDRPGVSVWRPV